MTFFGQDNYANTSPEHIREVLAREAEVPPAIGKLGTGQRIRVGVVERDNGLVMAKTSQISNALYDLADQNSTTHTVLLPHGTMVKLSAAVAPSVGSWRAKFEVSNPKLGKTVEAKGTSEAAELAGQIDLLALAKIDKDALAKVTEAYDRGDAVGMLVEMGVREPAPEPLREDQIHVSGYVTKSGRHVGAYGQIRKTLDKLEHGDSAHFPDGLTAKRTKGGFSVSGGEVPSKHSGSKDAADAIAIGSLNSDHPKSLGGKQHQSEAFGAAIQGNVSDRVDNLPADNPKLPGTPHPEAVAARAAAARKSAKRGRSSTTLDRGPTKDGEPIPPRDRSKPVGPGLRSPEEADAIRAGEHEPGGGKRKPGVTDARNASEDELIKNYKIMHGHPPNKKELETLRKSRARREKEERGRGKNNATADRGGSKNTTPSGLPLPPAAGPSKTSGGPGQRDDPSFANHRSNSDGSFGDVSAKTVEGWSDRILSREIDANPGRTTKERAHLKVMQTEYRRRKTAGAQHRGFIGG